MNDKKYKVTVEIYGESYALKGDIEVERVKALAALVDERMKAVAKTDARLSPTKIAVLAALNIAADYLRLENDYNHLVKIVKDENLP